MENILCDFADHLDVKKTTIRLAAIKNRYRVTGVNPVNISSVLIDVMKEASRLKKLTGSQKKLLVTRALAHIVEELIPGEDNPLEDILISMIPTLIDNIIDIGKAKAFTKRLARCL